MTTVKNIYDYINSFAPFEMQEEWDNSGFLIGGFKNEVKKCVLCLDVTNAVVDFAIVNNAELIISHHPVIFKALKSITDDAIQHKLIKNNISVISAHTSYDVANDGINDALAEKLELENIKNIKGFIRQGSLKEEMNCDDFAKFVKEKLNCNFVRYSKSSKLIKTAAVVGGSAIEFLYECSADAFVTGDASYHNILDSAEIDFCVVAAGHYETEILGVNRLRNKLKSVFTDIEFLNPNQENPVKVV